MKCLAFATLAVLAVCSAPAWAAKAHEHGVVRADIGVESGRITLSLELPLEDLAGFERAARTDAERAAITAALAKLQDAEKLVRIEGAASCGPAKVELVAPVWGVGDRSGAAPTAGATKEGHGDLEARYEFRCSNTSNASHLMLGLFTAFPRIKRVEVQAVSARGQMKLVLRRPNERIALAR